MELSKGDPIDEKAILGAHVSVFFLKMRMNGLVLLGVRPLLFHDLFHAGAVFRKQQAASRIKNSPGGGEVCQGGLLSVGAVKRIAITQMRNADLGRITELDATGAGDDAFHGREGRTAARHFSPQQTIAAATHLISLPCGDPHAGSTRIAGGIPKPPIGHVEPHDQAAFLMPVTKVSSLPM
jgi:hypothetical protein